jgi:hypothetical protein
MAQTFDTSRVGGGTYELEQDANGNYKLKSVDFAQVNKLNLPDLKTSDVTTPPVATIPKQPDVADPFKKLGTQNTGGGEGGGQDYSGVMLKTPEVKDVSVRDAGQPMTKIDTGKTDGKFLASGAAGGASLQGDKASDPFLSSGAAGGASLQSQTVDPITGAGRSQSDKFKERFDPTKIQAATPQTTGLQKVKSKASDAVGKVKDSSLIQEISKFSPLRIAANALGAILDAMLPEETNVQQLNKSYFNTREDGRIAGNPATDLYAGMNRNSAFGNLETAGAKRIATREKTAATKKVSDKFKADTEKMKEQQKDYQREKAAKQKATQGPAGSGGSSGSDSGRVICTDLHRTGELSTRDWVRDTKFTFKTLSKTHVKGYLLWAEPTVKHIQKYPRYRKVWKHIAQHRANDIAWRLNEGKFDLLGRIYSYIGEPVCWALGNFVSDKQISKYNLTHWRRA